MTAVPDRLAFCMPVVVSRVDVEQFERSDQKSARLTHSPLPGTDPSVTQGDTIARLRRGAFRPLRESPLLERIWLSLVISPES